MLCGYGVTPRPRASKIAKVIPTKLNVAGSGEAAAELTFAAKYAVAMMSWEVLSVPPRIVIIPW